MDSYPVVSWQEVQGNKYSRSLHPAMLTDNGYPVTASIKAIGKEKYYSQFVTINYDRTYVLKWLEVKVIKPLTNCGIEGVVNLLMESWEQSRISYRPLAKITNKDIKNYEKQKNSL